MGLLDGLHAYWKCDETSGNRVDSHVNGLDFTQVGFVGSATGALNLAIDGTGSDLNKLTSTSTQLNFGDEPITWTGWGRINTGEQVQDNPIISKSTTVGNQRAWTLTHRSSINRYRFILSGDGGNVNQTTLDWTSPPTLNVFEFIVAIHDPVANLMKLSVNNATLITAAHPHGIFASSTAVALLGGFDQSPDVIGLGFVDEVGIWKRELTTSEITTLYGGGTPPSFDTFTSDVVVGNDPAEYNYFWKRRA